MSQVDWHEVANAIDQTNREVRNRFDFKGSDARVEQADSRLTIHADDEYRVRQVRATSQERQRAFAAAHVGRTTSVVAEERTDEGLLRGLTGTYVPVWFEAPQHLMGSTVSVAVTRTEGPRAFGEWVSGT